LDPLHDQGSEQTWSSVCVQSTRNQAVLITNVANFIERSSRVCWLHAFFPRYTTTTYAFATDL